MKIYFEDNWLVPWTQMPVTDAVLNAGAGISLNTRSFEDLLKHHPDATVYTNSFVALDNKYCWNAELGVPELYIRERPNGEFIRVDQLTNRELREGHNLLKMYCSGEFSGKKEI